MLCIKYEYIYEKKAIYFNFGLHEFIPKRKTENTCLKNPLCRYDYSKYFPRVHAACCL